MKGGCPSGRTVLTRLFASNVASSRQLPGRRLCHQLGWQSESTCNVEAPDTVPEDSTRKSPLGIQLISRSLYEQLFPNSPKQPEGEPGEATSMAMSHLTSHGLWGRPTTTAPDVDFRLPPLRGATLDQHFRRIAEEQTRPYKDALQDLSECLLPPKPSKWRYAPGWTKYPSFGSPMTNEPIAVDYPNGDALVFDVEVCVNENQAPTLAVAASATHWFSWCSERLVDEAAAGNHSDEEFRNWSVNDLIPLENSDSSAREPKIIIGHNVAYDRSYVSEQYAIDAHDSKARFIDTMSLHIAVAGLTSEQRTLYLAASKGAVPTKSAHGKKYGNKFPILHWMDESTTNALKDVYNFYCGEKLDKEERNIFVTGNFGDVRANFSQLMAYCANDVYATHQAS